MDRPAPRSLDDAYRDVPLPPTTAHRNLRQAFICVGVCMLLLFAFEGLSLRHEAEQLKPGWQRTMVLTVAKPAGWVASKTGLHDVKQSLVAWVRPATDASEPATSDAATATRSGELATLVVTGDSMAQPLDAKLAQRFTAARSSTRVVSDVHLGTAISQPELLDWVATAKRQTKRWHPGAVVVLLGANEGFPFGAVECCGRAWVDEYARRATAMIDAWTHATSTRVYWLSLPTPRSADRKEISVAVNAAIARAVAARRVDARVVDLVPLFTPGGVFRASMPVEGRSTLVREADGVHLNERGSELAVGPVLDALRADFSVGVPR